MKKEGEPEGIVDRRKFIKNAFLTLGSLGLLGGIVAKREEIIDQLQGLGQEDLVAKEEELSYLEKQFFTSILFIGLVNDANLGMLSAELRYMGAPISTGSVWTEADRQHLIDEYRDYLATKEAEGKPYTLELGNWYRQFQERHEIKRNTPTATPEGGQG